MKKSLHSILYILIFIPIFIESSAPQKSLTKTNSVQSLSYLCARENSCKNDIHIRLSKIDKKVEDLELQVKKLKNKLDDTIKKFSTLK